MFLKRGSALYPVSANDLDLVNELGNGTFVVKKDDREELFLSPIDPVSVPTKLYGKTEYYANRFLNTFKERHTSTGVLLSGEKGSGKSLLAKTISVYATKQGIPTIVFNTPFAGDKFNQFIQRINTPSIMLFDEFEKTYDRNDQEKLLTLLDGSIDTKMMFIFTCNDQWILNQYMHNRPGRIYYSLHFAGVSIDFIREYCNDNLQYPKHTDKICQVSKLFSEFNFDMLKALVEEINRYNEDPVEVLEILNAKPATAQSHQYDIDDFYCVQYPTATLYERNWRGNPLAETFPIEFYYKDEDDSQYKTIFFNPQDLTLVENGKYTFANKDGKISLTKRVTNNSFSLKNYQAL